jgi:predicted amidohydrolase YtcJ
MKPFSRRDFLRVAGLGGASVLLDRFLTACNLKSPAPAAGTSAVGGQDAALGGAAEVIYTGGHILTMDDGQPTVEALAIAGGKILAVGSNDEVMPERGSDSVVVDLDGRTLMPGFVDSHSHIINSAPTKEEFLQLQHLALSGGITTTTEMTVTPELMDRLLAYDYRGYIRLRYNTYLGFNDSCGEPFDPEWYKSRPQGKDISAHIRNQGVKIFSDGGACNVPAVTFEYPGGYGHGDLYMTQEEMNRVVAQAQAAGYQVAVHALGDRAIEQVMNAIEAALEGGPNTMRHRIEHNAVVREDMLDRYNKIGIVPVMFGGYATCLRDDPNSKFKYVVPKELGTEEWPYRGILDANPGVHAAWHADYPVFKQMDPIQNLYGFVTRNEVAQDGHVCPAPDFLRHGAIRVDEALRIMTMGSAYALFRENEIGSLEVGKLADMVVLSDNPMQIEAESIKDLQVLVTMVGGSVEYCADGAEGYCPRT